MPRSFRLLCFALCLCLFALTGCGDDDGDSTAPTVTIVEPADGAVVDVTSTFTIEVENFEIVDQLGNPPVDGQGHFHVFLDGVYVEPNGAQAQLSFRIDQLSPSNPPEPGNHELRVQLVNNDHTFIEPEVSDSITITITE